MLFLVMWLFLSLAAGWLGKKRAAGFWGFFVASLFFTPVVVLLILALTQPTPEVKLESSPPRQP